MSTKKFRKSSRSSAPFLFVNQIVDNLKEFFQVAFPDETMTIDEFLN